MYVFLCVFINIIYNIIYFHKSRIFLEVWTRCKFLFIHLLKRNVGIQCSSSLFLKTLSDDALATHAGRVFQLLTTLCENDSILEHLVAWCLNTLLL